LAASDLVVFLSSFQRLVQLVVSDAEYVQSRGLWMASVARRSSKHDELCKERNWQQAIEQLISTPRYVSHCVGATVYQPVSTGTI